MQEITNYIIKAIEKKNIRILMISLVVFISFIAPSYLFIFFNKRELFLKVDTIKLFVLVIVINLTAAIPMYFIKWINEMINLFFTKEMREKEAGEIDIVAGEQNAYVKALFDTELNLVVLCLYIITMHIINVSKHPTISTVIFYLLINIRDLYTFIKNLIVISKKQLKKSNAASP